LADRLKRHYRLLPLPKRVWVLELNLASGYSEAPLKKGCRVGEILIDPSADIHGNLALAVHVNLTAIFEGPDKASQEGVFLYRSDWTKDPDMTERIDPDQTYLPYVHHGAGGNSS
jgi:F0F1-type ATP synthase membrane subunit a